MILAGEDGHWSGSNSGLFGGWLFVSLLLTSGALGDLPLSNFGFWPKTLIASLLVCHRVSIHIVKLGIILAHMADEINSFQFVAVKEITCHLSNNITAFACLSTLCLPRFCVLFVVYSREDEFAFHWAGICDK